MNDQPLVAFLGESVLMECLGESMRSELEVIVVWMDICTAGLYEQLNTLKPDMIVVDLETPRPYAVLALLRERPGTLFLGVDHISSQVIVLQSSQHPVRSMQEFCQLAQAELGCESRMQKGGEALRLLGDQMLSESS